MSSALRAGTLLIVFFFSHTLCAEHNSEFFDFDLRRGPFTPEVYSSTSSGNVYLGAFGAQSVRLFLMDALPALNNLTGLSDETDRRVTLNFDLVFPSTSLAGVNDQFTIHANDELVYQQSFLQLSALVTRRNVQTEFLLRYQPVFDPDSGSYMPFDLVLQFTKTGSSKTWGLDNVSIDWGQPVPEPSSAVLACISLTGAAFIRHHSRRALT